MMPKMMREKNKTWKDEWRWEADKRGQWRSDKIFEADITEVWGTDDKTQRDKEKKRKKGVIITVPRMTNKSTRRKGSFWTPRRDKRKRWQLCYGMLLLGLKIRALRVVGKEQREGERKGLRGMSYCRGNLVDAEVGGERDLTGVNGRIIWGGCSR